MNVRLPPEVFIAVNPKGILLIDINSKAIIASHPYMEIARWVYNASSFTLHLGTESHSFAVFFTTEEGEEISTRLHGYTTHLAAVFLAPQ